MAISSVFVELRASISDFQAKMGTAKAELDGLAKKGESTGKKMAAIGKGLTEGIVGAGIAVGVASVDMASKFQTSQTSIQANANITAGAAKKITNAFLETQGKTIYSAQTISNAYATVGGQLGAVEGHALTSKQAMNVMATSMDLAEASGTDLSSTTKDLASVMQSFQVPLSGAKQASDQLFSTSRVTGVGLDALTSTVDRLKSRLGAAAPTLGDLSSLLVDLNEHGVTGSRGLMVANTAVTTLLGSTQTLTAAQGTAANSYAKQVASAQAAVQKASDGVKTTQLQQAAAPKSAHETAAQAAAKAALAAQQLSGKQQTLAAAEAKLQALQAGGPKLANANVQALASLGLQVFNTKGQFVGMGSVIAQLQPKLKGMTQQQQLQALASIFGKSANKALLDTVLAGPAAFDKASAAVNRANSAHKAALVQAKTFQHQIDVLKASAEDEGVKIGNVLIPKLETLARDTEKVIDWFTKHKGAAEALGGAIAGLGAVFIGAYGIQAVSKFGKTIGDSYNSIKNLVGKLPGLGSSAKTAADEQQTAAEQASTALQTAADKMTTAAAQISESYTSISTSASEAAGAVTTAATEMSGAEATSATAIEGSAAATDLALESEGAAAETGAAGAVAGGGGFISKLFKRGGGAAAGGGELAGGELAAGGVAGGEAAATGLGATVGASSILPAVVAGFAAFKGTGDLLHHNVLGLGDDVNKVGNFVAGLFGHSAAQDKAKDEKKDAGLFTKADLPYLGEIVTGAVKSQNGISITEAKEAIKDLGGKVPATNSVGNYLQSLKAVADYLKSLHTEKTHVAKKEGKAENKLVGDYLKSLDLSKSGTLPQTQANLAQLKANYTAALLTHTSTEGIRSQMATLNAHAAQLKANSANATKDSTTLNGFKSLEARLTTGITVSHLPAKKTKLAGTIKSVVRFH